MRQQGTTEEFLALIKYYLQRGKFSSITDEVVARYIHDYISDEFSAGRIGKYDGGIMIGSHLHLYLQDAFDSWRTTEDPRFVKYRKEYESIAQDQVPNLVEVGGNGIRRALSVQSLGYMLCEIYAQGKDFWMRTALEQYCFAQDSVLQQKVHAFVVAAYRTGLAGMLDTSNAAGFSGKFGETTLRSFYTAGRVMFTFARSNPKSLWTMKEDQISIVGEDGEKQGVSFGVQSVYCDFAAACLLIEDVIKNWPKDLAKLMKVYKPDRQVSIA